METILLVILVIVTVTMIGAVLLQRSEGGALGIGGGGGPGAMFSARGSANFLTRMTAVLAAVFMILAMVLAILNKGSDEGSSVMDVATPPVQEDQDRLRSFESEDYEPVPLEELIEDSVPAVSESTGQSGNSDGPAVPAPD
ncbi:MAG: Protein-export membrane protein SecG [Alphaproteobacteria bacterium MarineAlpha10_Bin1]|nr:MAG: Protein-export membrane protein SecG [Alphaproteobacteria bacterium MarineAlpha10_Bin1]